MAMRRNRDTRTAVAAKPNEMALAFVGAFAPPPFMADAASASLASGCDGVSAPAIPTHGRDLAPANPLMALACHPQFLVDSSVATYWNKERRSWAKEMQASETIEAALCLGLLLCMCEDISRFYM
jgi:hypothetical protein